jgi:hypothetical protein
MRARRDLAFWLLGLGALALGLLAWTPLPPGIWHDDGVYLMLGRALARGDGLHYLGVPGDLAAPKFPPLYPAVTALTWWLGRDPLVTARLASLLNVAFVAGAIALTAAYGRHALRLSLPVAVAAGAIAALSVDLWRPALVALSEPLYTLALMAALWAAARVERADSGRRDAVVLGAALVLLVHVRTAGVAVVAAAVIGVALRRGWRPALAVAAPVVLLTIPWALWSSAAGRALPAPLRDILGPYGSWLAAQAGGSPAQYAASLPGAGLGVARRALELFVPAAPPLVWWSVAPLLGVAMVAGFWLLGRRSPTAALTLVLSLALAWLWPFQDRRLILPLLPLLLLALGVVVETLVARGRAQEWRGVGARACMAGLAVIGLWAAGFASTSAVRMSTGWVAAGYEIRARQLASALDAMRGRVPPDAVVGAPELWPALNLINGVRVAPSARFRPLAPAGEPVWGTPREQFQLWASAGITHVLLEQGRAIHGDALDALEHECPGVIRVLDARPGQILVRLDWDERCRARVGAD